MLTRTVHKELIPLLLRRILVPLEIEIVVRRLDLARDIHLDSLVRGNGD
jgi:hypothetical protein